MLVTEKKFNESIDHLMDQILRIRNRMVEDNPVSCACDVCEYAATTFNSSGACVLVCTKKLKAQCPDFTPHPVAEVEAKEDIL